MQLQPDTHGLWAATAPSSPETSTLSEAIETDVAIVGAGFTPVEADQLRRAMATFKLTGGVSHFYDKLVGGMVTRGYPKDFAERTFKQIEGFGSYGFPESHAASFALLVYASAWLKCHEPAAFLCALLNSQPMGFYSPSQLVQDARRHGVTVRPADVNHSQWQHTLEGPEHHLRLGLRLIRGLPAASAERIHRHRPRRGPRHGFAGAGRFPAAADSPDAAAGPEG